MGSICTAAEGTGRPRKRSRDRPNLEFQETKGARKVAQTLYGSEPSAIRCRGASSKGDRNRRFTGNAGDRFLGWFKLLTSCHHCRSTRRRWIGRPNESNLVSLLGLAWEDGCPRIATVVSPNFPKPQSKDQRPLPTLRLWLAWAALPEQDTFRIWQSVNNPGVNRRTASWPFQQSILHRLWSCASLLPRFPSHLLSARCSSSAAVQDEWL